MFLLLFCHAMPARSFLDTLPRGERRSLARAHCSLHLEREKISNEINPWGERARSGQPASRAPSVLQNCLHFRDISGKVFQRRCSFFHPSFFSPFLFLIILTNGLYLSPSLCLLSCSLLPSLKGFRWGELINSVIGGGKMIYIA